MSPPSPAPLFNGENARGEIEKIETLKHDIWVCLRETLSSTVCASGFLAGCHRGHFSTGRWSPPASGVRPWKVPYTLSVTGCVPGFPPSVPAGRHTTQLQRNVALLCSHWSTWLSFPLAGLSQENGPFPRVILTGYNAVVLRSHRTFAACCARVYFQIPLSQILHGASCHHGF